MTEGTKMDDETFDEETAQDWIAMIEKAGETARDRDVYPKLNEWLQRISPTEILEIGSGQGICSIKIDLSERNYTGLDPSSFLTNRAKELYSANNRNFVEGNAYALPFNDEAFAAVFSVMVWHLLRDLPKATQEMGRVLKPDGHFFIVTANPDAGLAWEKMYPNAKWLGKRLEGTIGPNEAMMSRDVLYLHTLDEIKQELLSAGLVIEGIETFRPSDNVSEQKMFVSISGMKKSPL